MLPSCHKLVAVDHEKQEKEEPGLFPGFLFLGGHLPVREIQGFCNYLKIRWL